MIIERDVFEGLVSLLNSALPLISGTEKVEFFQDFAIIENGTAVEWPSFCFERGLEYIYDRSCLLEYVEQADGREALCFKGQEIKSASDLASAFSFYYNNQYVAAIKKIKGS